MIRQSGFTLIEAVLVLVLLGVLSIGLAAFIDNATDHYADTAERTRLLGEARLALGRVGREIQGALPYSLRVREDGDTACVEFLPLVDGARYRHGGEGGLPVGDTAGEFDALGFAGVHEDPDQPPDLGDLNVVDSAFVAVYPVPPADDYIYADKGSLKPDTDLALRAYSGHGGASEGVVPIELAGGDTRFPRHAPAPRHFFLTKGPVSFCLEDGALSRHAGYTLSAKQPLFQNSVGRPLARNLGPGSELELKPAGLQRRGLLRLRLVLERRDDKNEPLEVEHAFAVRNRP